MPIFRRTKALLYKVSLLGMDNVESRARRGKKYHILCNVLHLQALFELLALTELQHQRPCDHAADVRRSWKAT